MDPDSFRKMDGLFVVFFALSVVVAVVFDSEILLGDSVRLKMTLFTTQDVWPPKAVVEMLHQWADQYDPLSKAKPAWFKVPLETRSMSRS